MRNESIKIAGSRTYTYGNPAVSTYQTVGISQSHTVVASPENKKGDFVNPNAFKFEITSTKINRSFYKVRQRSYPAQQWDGNSNSTNGGYSASSTTLPYPYQSLDGLTTLRDRALAKVYSQMRGNSNLATDLAESGQTMRMLREAVKLQRGFVSIVNLIISRMPPPRKPKKQNQLRINGTLYNRRTGRAVPDRLSERTTLGQQRLDYVTGKWLEARYGWTPLINSCYDAYDNLMRSQVAERKTFASRSANRKECNVRIDYAGSGYKSHPVRIEETLKERIRIVYEFTLPEKGIWDWTSLNPAAIAWELVPLSFVADWFFTIGKSLENLENYWLWKSSFVGGYETYTYEIEQHRTCTHEWTPVLPVYSGQVDLESVIYDGFWRKIYKDRKLVTSLPFPGRPRFEVRLGAKQMLDSAALLHQFIGKRFR